MLLVPKPIRDLIVALSNRPNVDVSVGQCGQMVTVRFAHADGVCATAVKLNDPLVLDQLEALVAEPVGPHAASNAMLAAKTRQYCRYDSETQGDGHAVCA